MQTYYFYHHATEHSVILAAQSCAEHELLFKWGDCLRSEVIHQKKTMATTSTCADRYLY
ncbi:hypothetical protein SAMN05421749_102163 [Acinetobacter marinus]|uniref:Uncharacterized protein n=1 Tax=Acinetobacter marinus TaxID=281375 RepID=A0A1G6HF96_9GAMM|nr:hypothetical protein SAMN05421749_102163 [Acinetobacter marinus]